MKSSTANASHPHIKEDNSTNVEPPSSPRHRKVLARWVPVDSRRPVIDEAPVFHPTLEDFKDTLAYIEKIRPLAEPFGICRIVPPENWSPPCRLREKSIWENTKFPTRIQNVGLLQNRGPMNEKKKRKGKAKMITLARLMKKRKRNSNETTEEENFGFNTGSNITLEEFEKYAQYFKASYFEREDNTIYTPPSIEEIEGEYWRIIEKPNDNEVEVYYGTDLERGVLRNEFDNRLTRDSEMDQYVASGWYLENLPRLPSSLLSFEESNISGIVEPWLYIAMCFSSFCWHVEDHHLYSINYHHFGEPKVWYGVPGSHATELEKVMRRHLPDLFREQRDLLHGLVTQFSPSILKENGVPVYRLVQNAGEFVITFPRAYHCGFNAGFNCAEAVNFAPVEWLRHGQDAVELYSREKHETTLSHDKLLLGAAYEAVKLEKRLSWRSFCGKNGMLTEAIRTRLHIEERRIKALGKSIRLEKMDKEFDSRCVLCFYDLHLSAFSCHNCSEGIYACIKHARNLCLCKAKDRFILLRYSMDELSSLVKALERESDDFAAYVELIKPGVLVLGRFWDNTDAIFPKGFTSRVRFYNVLEPRIISDYISEVLDGGSKAPLFRVTLEESPNESFDSVSAQQCWEMVLKRVRERSESVNIPTASQVKGINGLKMFGFFSPSIVQVMGDLESNRKLVEYWNNKDPASSSRSVSSTGVRLFGVDLM